MESENCDSEFLGGLKVWENTYNLMIRKGAKDYPLLTSLALKNLTRAADLFFFETYGEIEFAEYLRVLNKLKKIFDPEIELANLKVGTTLCISFKPNSYLVEEYETDKICAKFLYLNLESCRAPIKNDLTGEYEGEDSYISLYLAYPTKKDLLLVTWPDIEEVEAFTL